MSNEEVISDYIKECNMLTLNPAWVFWALNLIREANKATARRSRMSLNCSYNRV